MTFSFLVSIRGKGNKDRQNQKFPTGGRCKPGHADLLKTISMGLIADGLIFKDLIGHLRLVIQDVLP